MENTLDTPAVEVRKTKPSDKRTLGGRPAFNTKQHEAFTAQPLERKAEILKRQWANIGYILLCQGERFAQSVTKKDYGRLMQLLSSAGIAYDKVVPKGEIQGNLVFNLFNGLDRNKLQGVLGMSSTQPTVIDVEPIESITSIEPLQTNP
jgi:hypothetical protein